MPDERFVSPIASEGILRVTQTGRAQLAEVADLREDFATAVRHTMLVGETIEKLIVLRPSHTGSTYNPSAVLLLTDRALLYLHQPAGRQETGYGIRARIVPFRNIAVAELGQQLLQGTFLIDVLGGSRTAASSFAIRDRSGGALEVQYHTLDDALFVDLLRDVRRLADL